MYFSTYFVAEWFAYHFATFHRESQVFYGQDNTLFLKKNNICVLAILTFLQNVFVALFSWDGGGLAPGRWYVQKQLKIHYFNNSYIGI